MKKIATLMFAVFLTICMTVPAMADGGLNSDEQGLYDYFAAQVNSQTWLGTELNANYLSQAETALTKTDLDKTACDDLRSAIDAVMQIISTNGVDSLSKAQDFHDDYLNVINPVAGKYNMKVELDAKTGHATVYVDNAPVIDTKPVVNQTGFNSVVIAVIIAVIVAAVICAYITIRKRKLFH